MHKIKGISMENETILLEDLQKEKESLMTERNNLKITNDDLILEKNIMDEFILELLRNILFLKKQIKIYLNHINKLSQKSSSE